MRPAAVTFSEDAARNVMQFRIAQRVFSNPARPIDHLRHESLLRRLSRGESP